MNFQRSTLTIDGLIATTRSKKVATILRMQDFRLDGNGKKFALGRIMRFHCLHQFLQTYKHCIFSPSWALFDCQEIKRDKVLRDPHHLIFLTLLYA
jgi:hypothetical protein